MFQYTTDEPVYALATAFMPSALAVIRASGKDSLKLLAPYFKGRLEKVPSNTAVHGWIIDENGEKVDEVIVIKYEKGRGYTSEEAFEIMSHGSLPVIRKISSVLERAGFRQALRGEFTYRAFMHGRMDLTEAEAVEELVKAGGEKGREDAMERLSGSVRKEAEDIRSEIVNILASLEVQLDYGEDEIIEDWVFPEERVDSLITRLERMSSTFRAHRIYTDGAKVVLAGRTNAGKSSLFNALLKENRAIVSPRAGTTRDYLEAECDMDGIPVRLFDTAGIREGEDEIEREGIERSERMMEEADLVLYVLDGGEKEPEEKRAKTIYVHSKSDLTPSSGLSFSSLTGEGIGDVVETVVKYLTSSAVTPTGVPVIESRRQKEKIDETIAALRDAEENRNMSVDIIALFFQSALEALGELTGEITTEDILDELFSSFCLGK
jgi:tRNA modification GTPase